MSFIDPKPCSLPQKSEDGELKAPREDEPSTEDGIDQSTARGSSQRRIGEEIISGSIDGWW